MPDERWQPIETAPKDQSQKERLLGYCPFHGVEIMRYGVWGEGTGGFEIPGSETDGFAIWIEFPATHWQPLPEPPTNGQ
jgi:hypothetical protein